MEINSIFLIVIIFFLGCSGKTNDTFNQPKKWTSAGNMNHPRKNNTATLLSNGRILVTGGRIVQSIAASNTIHSTSEIYDSSNNRWIFTGNLNNERFCHTATKLMNGKVLISGGIRNTDTLSSAEIYDPITETFKLTNSMLTPRARHTATLLPDGKVLVAGGIGIYGYLLSSSEIYDPVNETWTSANNLSDMKYLHTANLLQNGKIIITGGLGITTFFRQAEIYDPNSNTWTAANNMQAARASHIAVLLGNGELLVAGGISKNIDLTLNLKSSEIFNPVTQTWSYTGNLNDTRVDDSSVLMKDGKVFVSGSGSAEIYNPTSQTWVRVDSPEILRSEHTTVLLDNGNILVIGGSVPEQTHFARATTASSEIFHP